MAFRNNYKGSTIHRRELYCKTKLNPQPTSEYTHTHTPTSPLWKSSHAWFPCHQNDSSLADKRNSQVLSRRRTRNAFYLFAHQVKNYCLWSKAEITGQMQQNLAHIWGNTETHCRWKLCLSLKEKHLCRNIIATKSLWLLEQKKCISVSPTRPGPVFCHRFLVNYYWMDCSYQKAPCVLLSSRSFLLNMWSVDQQQHPGSLVQMQNQATPQSHL